MGKRLKGILIGAGVLLFYSVYLTRPGSHSKDLGLLEPGIEKPLTDSKASGEEVKEPDQESFYKNPVKDNVQTIEVSVEERSRVDVSNKFLKSYEKIHTIEFDDSDEVSLNLILKESDKMNFKNVVLISKGGDVLPFKFSIDEDSKKTFGEGENLFKDDWVSLSSKKESLSSIQLGLKSFAKNSVVEVYVQKFKKAGI